jgi:hypothetical protein
VKLAGALVFTVAALVWTAADLKHATTTNIVATIGCAAVAAFLWAAWARERADRRAED